MSLTVRQCGQIAPEVKVGLDNLTRILEENDEVLKYLKSTVRGNTLRLDETTAKIRSVEHDKESIGSTLHQLDELLTSFQSNFLAKQSNLVASLQSTSERINSTQSLNTSSVILEMPHPYFQQLYEQYLEQLTILKRRIEENEKALLGYSREKNDAVSFADYQDGSSMARKIEMSLRANYAQFKAIAGALARLEERMESAKQAALRNKGINVSSFLSTSDAYNRLGAYQTPGNLLGGQLGLGLRGNEVPPANFFRNNNIGQQQGQTTGVQQQQTTGGGGANTLFGGGNTTNNTGGLFGNTNTQATGTQPTGGLGLFGANNNAGAPQQNTGGGGGLFGGGAGTTQPGGNTQTGGGNLFGAGGGGGAQGGGLFGGGGGLFGPKK